MHGPITITLVYGNNNIRLTHQPFSKQPREIEECRVRVYVRARGLRAHFVRVHFVCECACRGQADREWINFFFRISSAGSNIKHTAATFVATAAGWSIRRSLRPLACRSTTQYITIDDVLLRAAILFFLIVLNVIFLKGSYFLSKIFLRSRLRRCRKQFGIGLREYL